MSSEEVKVPGRTGRRRGALRAVPDPADHAGLIVEREEAPLPEEDAPGKADGLTAAEEAEVAEVYEEVVGTLEVYGPTQDPRARTVELVAARLENLMQPVDDSGLWTGVRVVTRKDLLAALADPLPAAAETTANVRTPAYVYVEAVCPRCYVPGAMAVVLTASLVVSADHSAELKLKAKAAALPHVCGQRRLPSATSPTAPGQIALPQPAAVPETCPAAGCVLPADHAGPHDAIPAAELDPPLYAAEFVNGETPLADTDDGPDLLPEP